MLKHSLRILLPGLLFSSLFQCLPKPQESREPAPPVQPTEAITSAPAPTFSARHPRDFDDAKSILKKLYPRGVEIYCGCPYDLERKNRIDAAACGYKGQGVRSKRIEWEHVVPASVFGQRFAEWKDGHPSCGRNGRKEKGRSCARATSETFARMEADLFNLLPSLGELNAARSNFAFGEVGGEPRDFGSCDFEVRNRVAEPRREIRGDLARIYFYMDARYPGYDIINKRNEGLLSAWDREDPMDDAEKQRIQQIEDIQGNSFYIGRLSRMSQASK